MLVTEIADVSTETLRYMSIIAAVNCALAALGVAIAYYVYFYVPHSVEVHYTGKFGEVVSSAATYSALSQLFLFWLWIASLAGAKGGASWRFSYGRIVAEDWDFGPGALARRAVWLAGASRNKARTQRKIASI